MGKELVLAAMVFFPFIAGILVYGAGVICRGKSSATGQKNLRDGAAVGSAAMEWGMAALFMILQGASGGEEGALFWEIPDICGLGLSFTLDGFRGVYGCIIAFMWMMAAIASREYFAGHHKRNRFYLFLLWTLGATEGVFLSADLYTTFVFFEVMSFTSYVWVAQEETKEALRAADTYLGVAVLGGLVMLMGIFLLYHQLGTLEIRELSRAAADMDRRGLYAAGACMLFGFGAKAGAFPLHIWLPKAHPVAPAPASALLSGVLTKAGIYGILILSSQIFSRDETWGGLLLLTGVVTMLGGAVLAVFSVDLKRTLACSSMSQIGFILVGIAMLTLPGEVSATAARGTVLHMINHSLIKLVLFLAAGVIFQNTHALNLNRIRGFGRKKPLLAFVFGAGGAAIAGIPLFGGYVSKTLLHESIVEYGGGLTMQAVEWLFLFSGGLTVAYMAKLFIAVFVEKNADPGLQEKYDGMSRYWNPGTKFAVAGSALLLLVWGFFPHIFMERTAGLMQGFLGITDTMPIVSYFTSGNLKGAVISILIGAVVYLFFIRKYLMEENGKNETQYRNMWPAWLDLEERIYRPLLLKVLPICFGILCRLLDSLADGIVVLFRKTLYRDSKLPRERLEGNMGTEVLGKLLNAFQYLGNHTWRRDRPAHRDYVHLAAIKSAEIRETNHIIHRSLSFGLLLVCIGLSLTLFYLIWWE